VDACLLAGVAGGRVRQRIDDRRRARDKHEYGNDPVNQSYDWGRRPG
jgi:hypothetical protein